MAQIHHVKAAREIYNSGVVFTGMTVDGEEITNGEKTHLKAVQEIFKSPTGDKLPDYFLHLPLEVDESYTRFDHPDSMLFPAQLEPITKLSKRVNQDHLEVLYFNAAKHAMARLVQTEIRRGANAIRRFGHTTDSYYNPVDQLDHIAKTEGQRMRDLRFDQAKDMLDRHAPPVAFTGDVHAIRRQKISSETALILAHLAGVAAAYSLTLFCECPADESHKLIVNMRKA